LACEGEGDIGHESGCGNRRWTGWSAVRFRDDNPADLARARVAGAAWRDRNPAGTDQDLIAAIGHQFYRNYSVVLRAALFAVDRHQAREITGVRPEAFR
jgi:hypothetical protein